jgi:hypothetical protein
MIVKVVTTRVLRAAAVVLLSTAVAGAPALTYAQHPGGGGHAGGGAHFGGGGGGHFAGGAHYAAPHYSGHFGGYAGGGYAAHSYAAPHFAAGAHFAPATHFAAAGPHFGPAGHAAWAGRYGAGWYGGHYWGGTRFWGGGYWHGVFWPHIGFYPGWAWWLPVLPLGYATFWWGGVPYYYYNSLYYTWNPGYNGYVVTEPPPVAGDNSAAPAAGDYGAANSADNSGDNSGSGEPNAPPPADQPAPVQPGPTQSPPYGGGGGAGDVYLYPRNGQSDAQAANDRYECHSWAVNQTGFDPTRGPQQGSGNVAEYRRAMIACLDARGYSAR